MSQIDQIREAAEADLLTFIRLVAPHLMIGAVHEELISWWQRQGAKEKARQKSFKARHAKNIAKGKMSAAYWADKVKW